MYVSKTYISKFEFRNTQNLGREIIAMGTRH